MKTKVVFTYVRGNKTEVMEFNSLREADDYFVEHKEFDSYDLAKDDAVVTKTA